MTGGYIEINDTNSSIRGTMAGVDGTFSGTFSSNNIDAISSVNVRDGAVSAYYHFHFAKNSSDVSFTVLKQPFTSIVDIVIPVSIEEAGEGNPNRISGYKPATISVYKNGVLFIHKDMHPNSRHYVSYISALRIVDFNVNSNTTYRVVVTNHWAGGYYFIFKWIMELPIEYTGFNTRVELQGQISVGFRKR